MDELYENLNHKDNDRVEMTLQLIEFLIEYK